MDRPPHPPLFDADPFAKPDHDRLIDEPDPWGLGESPEGGGFPKSIHEIREVYLSWRNRVASSPGVAAPDPSRRPTIAARVWAAIQSRLVFNRRVVAGLLLVGVACAVIIGLSRYDLAPSIKTLSGATYNTALDRLASAVSAALDFVGAAPVATDVASIASTKGPNARPATGKRGPINSSRAPQLLPLISPERVQANGPAPIGDADAIVETKEALLPEDDSAVETPMIYSSTDTDISPPVAIRSPGIATLRDHGEKNVLLVEILVSETGGVESARGRQRPATLGAAVQSNMALSVVKTWRFSPARKDGQPVKYRVTVPFVETMNVARQD